MAWDLGELDKADAYYEVTSQCAATAGHPPLRALALTYTSYGASTPKAKLEFLSQAANDVRGHGNATAAVWALGRHAEEAPAAGDETGALRALDRARFAYDFADHTSEQAWVRFVTPYRMDSLALSVCGSCGVPNSPLQPTPQSTASETNSRTEASWSSEILLRPYCVEVTSTKASTCHGSSRRRYRPSPTRWVRSAQRLSQPRSPTASRNSPFTYGSSHPEPPRAVRGQA